MREHFFVCAAAMACLAISAVASAQTVAPAQPTVSASAPAEAPATAPARAGADYCKTLIDEYDAAKERQKFLAAAGVDNEMDQKQFDADKAKGDGFVRPFERWDVLLRFDKNGNKKIDWFEADAYRQDLRQRVLAGFDADKDGKLTGEEREKANLSLDRGWMGAVAAQLAGRAVGPGRGAGAGMAGGAGGAEGDGQWGQQLDRPEVIRRYDKDGDGQLSEEERAAAFKDFQEQQTQEMLKKYDKDGDGQLSAEESAAMREDQRKQARPWQQMIDKVNRRLFETDEEGQLTEIGKVQAKEFGKQLQAVGKEWELRLNDLDGDGNVSPEERKEVQAAWRMQALRLIGMATRYMDADGDGKVTAAEREAFMVRAQQGVEKWLTKFVDKYDTAGTGKLGEEQRAELIKGLREQMEQRVRKFDTEGKGRLTPAQTLDLLEDFAKEIGLAPKPKTITPPPEEEQN